MLPSTRPPDAAAVVDAARVQALNARPRRDGRYVLYWMQQSQRADDNHALEEAIAAANEARLPVVVGFGLDGSYPEASERAYRFLLEGLLQTREALDRRGIRLVVREGQPPEVALGLADDAALLVCDRGYLRHQRAWRARVAEEAPCAVVQVESDVVVPVDEASDKAEVGARTLRPRLRRQLERFLVPVPRREVRVRAEDTLGRIAGMELGDAAALARRLGGGATGPVERFHPGGAAAAEARLARLVGGGLRGYAARRGRIEEERGSGLSMYLHFGQLSPLRLALAVASADAPEEDREAYLEQLVVRRELSANLTRFRDDYDAYEGLPAWARTTLEEHRGDRRPALYDDDGVVEGATHDPYFNAAMREMRETGAMHNTMRMYWGKKLLEWSADPAQGFERTLRLNNRFFLDGRDPNSYAGVAWCYGMHDRPWPERAVYGKVRSMTAGGLERKYDPDAYVARVDAVVGA